jgi:lipoprotein-anchoring transpeptidase ErfK/SrfK
MPQAGAVLERRRTRRHVPSGLPDPDHARRMEFHAGAGIHRTDDVSSLGRAASRECNRMSIADVIELYEIVPMKTALYIG